MKTPSLTTQDKTRVLIACVELPTVYRISNDPDYIGEILVTVLDFYLQSEVVIKAMHYFRENVQNQYDVHSHDRLTELLGSYPDTLDGNTQASLFLWNNRHWKRARLLRGLLSYFSSIGITDQAQLHAWAKQAEFDRDFAGKVSGLGLAVFQWLLIRCGVQTVKPDVWVFRFVQRVLGHKLSNRVTVALFNELAPLIGTSMSKIDAAIWTFERMDMAKRDAPALRLVFWQQLKTHLENHIESDRTFKAGRWRIDLDDVHRLRYDLAGLRMSGQMRLSGESRQLATKVQIVQSSWQERFGLRLTIWRDRPLESDIWVKHNQKLVKDGWIPDNATRFEAVLDLNTNALMNPNMSVDELMVRVNEVAKRVVDAIDSTWHARIEASCAGPA